MANKLINKYVWLVETIYRAGRITFEEINQQWLDEEMDDKPIPLRTFHKWRIAAEEMFNINIECKRIGGYHYYIDNIDDFKSGKLRNWLFSTIAVSNLLLSCQSLKERILLEDIPSGQNHLAVILDAMKENQVINITYHSYWEDEEYNFDVEPFCVKLFRQRWYLVALSTNEYYRKKGPKVYALDRIVSLMKTGITFAMPNDWDADAYFDGFMGVLRENDCDKAIVKIKVTASQANYLRDLKIHHSQQEIERNEKYSIFTFYLRPTFDFQQELLWNADNVEVLEPQWLRDEMATRIKHMLAHYRPKDQNSISP